MPDEQAVCGSFLEETTVAKTVDDPEVSETQVPEEQAACGSFQGDIAVAKIADDQKVPETSEYESTQSRDGIEVNVAFELQILNTTFFIKSGSSFHL